MRVESRPYPLKKETLHHYRIIFFQTALTYMGERLFRQCYSQFHFRAICRRLRLLYRVRKKNQFQMHITSEIIRGFAHARRRPFAQRTTANKESRIKGSRIIKKKRRQRGSSEDKDGSRRREGVKEEQRRTDSKNRKGKFIETKAACPAKIRCTQRSYATRTHRFIQRCVATRSRRVWPPVSAPALSYAASRSYDGDTSRRVASHRLPENCHGGARGTRVKQKKTKATKKIDDEEQEGR